MQTWKSEHDEEGDDSLIEVSDLSDAKMSQTQKPSLSLDLRLAEPKSAKSDKDAQFMSPAIQETEVLVVFDLPDGSQGEKSFKLGQTVEVLKSFVESEYGIPMSDQSLFLEDFEGKRLDNPFSLLDYPEFKGNQLTGSLFYWKFSSHDYNCFYRIGCDEMYVRVEGYLPKFSKK